MMRALQVFRASQIYYGWIMLGTVSLTEVVSWGILYYAFSVFIAPMQTELGWSRAALTGAYSLALLCAGLAAVPVGWWLDRYGPRALMTVGSCGATLLLVAWAQVQQLWIFYLIMAGIGIVSATVLYEPAFAIVAIWFRRQRGRALTILTFFGAWASVVFLPLSGWLISAYGWRTTVLLLAGILAGVTILPHALLLRRHPHDLGLAPDGTPHDAASILHAETPERAIALRPALREARFWWLAGAFAISAFVTVAVTVHLIPYLMDAGQSATSAATITGMFGVMSLVGRLTIGPLGDRFPRQGVTAGLMALQAAGLVVLACAPTIGGATLAIALFGIGSGTLTIMRAALLAEHYGAAHYGRINGVQSLVLTGARTLAPVSTGLLAHQLGGYPALLWLLAGATTLGALTLLTVGRHWQPAGYRDPHQPVETVVSR